MDATPAASPSRPPPSSRALAAVASQEERSDRGVRGDGDPAAESRGVASDRGDPDSIDRREVEPDFVPRLPPPRVFPLSSESDPLRLASKSGGKSTWLMRSRWLEEEEHRFMASLCCCASSPAQELVTVFSSAPRGAKAGGPSASRGELLSAPELRSELCAWPLSFMGGAGGERGQTERYKEVVAVAVYTTRYHHINNHLVMYVYVLAIV